MKNLICIIAGEPNSINSELIGKIWKKKDNFKGLNIFIIGNYSLIKKQFRQIGIRTKMRKIYNIQKQNFNKELLVYDVPLKFKNPFKVSSKIKSKYIVKCLKLGIELAKSNKISGLINCPINKFETFVVTSIFLSSTIFRIHIGYGQQTLLSYFFFIFPFLFNSKLSSIFSGISYFKFNIGYVLFFYYLSELNFKKLILSILPLVVGWLLYSFITDTNIFVNLLEPIKLILYWDSDKAFPVTIFSLLKEYCFSLLLIKKPSEPYTVILHHLDSMSLP